MRRKLIKQGLGGYTVYLPKKWVEKKGLKVGDEVAIDETDTALSIHTETTQKHDITFLLTADNRKHLEIVLTHLYRRGFDSIGLQGATPKAADEVRSIAQRLLLGFEVTQRNGEHVLLENLSEPTAEKFDSLLNRIFQIDAETILLLQDELRAPTKAIKRAQDLRDQCDKLVLFCRRLLTKERYERNPILHWELLTFLLHIQHAVFYTIEYVCTHAVRASNHVIELASGLRTYFDLLLLAYRKQDIEYVYKINHLRSEYQFGKCYEYMFGAEGHERNVIAHLREAFRLIQVGTSPLLALFLEGGLQPSERR